ADQERALDQALGGQHVADHVDALDGHDRAELRVVHAGAGAVCRPGVLDDGFGRLGRGRRGGRGRLVGVGDGGDQHHQDDDEAADHPTGTLGYDAREVDDCGGGRDVNTIVYIEDNAANLDLVKRVLESTGQYRVIGVDDGQAGLELVRKERPALVLVD